MSYVATKILRISAIRASEYPELLIRRDVPIPIKEFAIEWLYAHLPQFISRFGTLRELKQILEYVRKRGYWVPPIDVRIKLGTDVDRIAVSPDNTAYEWTIKLLTKRDDEDIFQYYKRVGVTALAILANEKLTSYLERRLKSAGL